MFKILIIDPNRPFRQSLKRLLVGHFPSIKVETACDGDEGLEMIDTFHPHLIFLEIHLPLESGLELACKIKKASNEVIIALLTSYDVPEYHAAAGEFGIECVVPKDNWTGEDIIGLVQSILSELNPEQRSDQNEKQPL